MRRTRILSLIATLATVAAVAAAPAPALSVVAPVKCAASDVTPDGRVFPEPRTSATFLRLPEFECGITFLESQHPDLIEVTSVGKSKGGHDIWNILLTDETVTEDKEELLVISSIHGNEIGAREGAARVMEDMVDPQFLGDEEWVDQVLDSYVINFVFANPDGWVKGDIYGHEGSGLAWTRANNGGRDLNRNFPVKGFISTNNGPLEEPESQAIVPLLESKAGDWFLGTDNHGQLTDTYAAAGLQIVGQFDYQKSETLARFADGIADGMAEYTVLSELRQLEQLSGQQIGPYRWGTLYDILGYSASGSLIDYYNTFDGINGTGFATELTMSNLQASSAAMPIQLLNQVWVDSIRGINYTMFKQAIDRRDFTYEVAGDAAYVFDPERIRHDDANLEGFPCCHKDDMEQAPYDVSRMKFFEDLNKYADRPLTPVRVGEILAGDVDLSAFDSVVLANDAMPEAGDEDAYFTALREFVAGGGNLIVTDAAAQALPRLTDIPIGAISSAKHYVGFVDFTDREHPLNADLRGVASQTYDTVPIGYAFGGGNAAPNWKVSTEAWEAAGGTTTGTNGDGQTIYGELPVGGGRIRFLGALLPDPTEEYYHPYGLQNYAVTYTGYTLLQNMLAWERP